MKKIDIVNEKIEKWDDYQEVRTKNDENKRAIFDMLIVYNSKMYINEKNYTMRLIDNLHRLGYYKNVESLFKDIR